MRLQAGSTDFDTKQHAQQWARRIEGEMDSGLYLDRPIEVRAHHMREALGRYQEDCIRSSHCSMPHQGDEQVQRLGQRIGPHTSGLRPFAARNV
ncbi:hypothetical protein LMG27177_02824 [Paraburkholderia fynbosensis]|uniref:Uncharacterized protein n=1 Tax=Paraburkholderia fynbosensis TaxID=1200993 RepID=A0A6J5G456_9BURK|nr:hypothetical protein LMG27177_02824 [Paraburkholderia fynbosensis]